MNRIVKRSLKRGVLLLIASCWGLSLVSCAGLNEWAKSYRAERCAELSEQESMDEPDARFFERNCIKEAKIKKIKEARLAKRAAAETAEDDEFGTVQPRKSNRKNIAGANCVAASSGATGKDGKLVDSRDGTEYPTVKIGNQVWMAKNLNVDMPSSKCYGNDSANCEKYGRLYAWDAAMKACPSGWHLPSDDDFYTLLDSVGEIAEERAKNLRARSWISRVIDGLDKYGFAALPAGHNYYGSNFYGVGSDAYFWSSTEPLDYAARALSLQIGEITASVSSLGKDGELSVRCIQDSYEECDAGAAIEQNKGSMKDSRDGKTYKTVKIGDQVWMAENLNVKMDSSWCYENDPANCKKYGRLYTWEAARDACPSGWHLPNTEDFKTLLGTSSSGSNLRVSSWNNGLDKYGFAALPSGYINNYKGASFWSSNGSSNGSSNAHSLRILDDNALVYGADNKNAGKSVRCLQDSNKESEGSMKDSRDGKTYKTVKIGNQVWMAENLNYKTSSSVCYNNDPANCEKYGSLYTWNVAKYACPSGWHLPRMKEFEMLLATAGIDDEESARNLSVGIWRWTPRWDVHRHESKTGLDKYDFSALPAGRTSYGNFIGLGEDASFWSSTENIRTSAYSLYINGANEARLISTDKDDVRSVRCLQD